MIIGSPDTVIRKLRDGTVARAAGDFGVWTNDGSISHEDTMRCLTDGPGSPTALRDIGKELELTDPFQKTLATRLEGVPPALTIQRRTSMPAGVHEVFVE